ANLRNVEGAKQQWAMEHNASSNAVVTWENIHPYIGRGPSSPLPKCPSGGSYTIGTVSEAPSCSMKEHTAAFQESKQQVPIKYSFAPAQAPEPSPPTSARLAPAPDLEAAPPILPGSDIPFPS